MPHDRNGQPLAKGDIVTMVFTVNEVYPGETACNVHLVAIKPPGVNESSPGITCNSKFADKVDSSPYMHPAEPAEATAAAPS